MQFSTHETSLRSLSHDTALLLGCGGMLAALFVSTFSHCAGASNSRTIAMSPDNRVPLQS